MRRLLREPLLHFLALGALLFAAYAWVGGGAPRRGEIIVTRGQVESLSATFARTWQRAPTQEELAGLVQSWVREEVLYREGLALGLDRDDPVIRKRVGMKLEFLSGDAPDTEPSEAELAAWLASHAASYALPARVSFEQRAFGEDEPRAERALRQLRAAGAAPASADDGDATLLPTTLEDASAADVEGLFGPEFAAALAHLETGTWQGPIRSAIGLHLVCVVKRGEARAPQLAEVRDAVARDVARERERGASELLYRRLLQRYRVTVETPEVASSPDPAPPDGTSVAGSR